MARELLVGQGPDGQRARSFVELISLIIIQCCRCRHKAPGGSCCLSRIVGGVTDMKESKRAFWVCAALEVWTPAPLMQ